MTHRRHNLARPAAPRGRAAARPAAASGVSACRAGFTLLELLVALAMAGIIAGSLYSALRTGVRARTSAEAAVEPVRTAALATALLRADFESARPTAGALSGPFVGTDTTGDAGLAADTVEFYTLGSPTDSVATAAAATAGASNAGPAGMVGAAAPATATGEARRVQVGLVPYPGAGGFTEQVLVRRVYTNLLSQVELEPYEEVLCRGVRSLNIRYFDGLSWQDNWDSTLAEDNIPSAVEVTVEFDRSVDGQVKVFSFPRIFLVSCSTPSPTSGSQGSSQGAAGGTTP